MSRQDTQSVAISQATSEQTALVSVMVEKEFSSNWLMTHSIVEVLERPTGWKSCSSNAKVSATEPREPMLQMKPEGREVILLFYQTFH